MEAPSESQCLRVPSIGDGSVAAGQRSLSRAPRSKEQDDESLRLLVRRHRSRRSEASRSPDRCVRQVLWRGHLLPWREGDRATPVLAGRAHRGGSRFDRGSARGSPRGGGGRAPGPGLFGLCDQPEAGGPRARVVCLVGGQGRSAGRRGSCGGAARGSPGLPASAAEAPGAGPAAGPLAAARGPGEAAHPVDPEDPRPAPALLPGDVGAGGRPVRALGRFVPDPVGAGPDPGAGPAAAARHSAESVAGVPDPEAHRGRGVRPVPSAGAGRRPGGDGGGGGDHPVAGGSVAAGETNR